jgi:hypothetical protein
MMEGEAVAWFEIRTAGAGPDGESDSSIVKRQLIPADTHGSIEICGNEQFVLGRDPESW